MLLLTPAQTAALQDWFLPERADSLIGPHVIATGHGRGWVDLWPAPRAVLVETGLLEGTGGNYSLHGDPGALTPADIRPHIRGFVYAPASFAPLLHAAFPDLQVWQRVIYAPLADKVACRRTLRPGCDA